MPWATPKVDVLAGGPIIMAAVSTAKVVDGLSGEGFGGKSGPGDDNLAVFVLVSGIGGLKSGHKPIVLMATNFGDRKAVGNQRDCEFCRSHSASSASVKSPAARA